MKSYLNGRSYAVRLGPNTSKIYRCFFRNLKPLLFLLYINDLRMVPQDNSCLLFANDAKIYRQIHEPEDHLQLQATLTEFVSWFKRNALSVVIDRSAPKSHSVAQDRSLTIRLTWSEPRKSVLCQGSRSPEEVEEHIDQVVASCNLLLGLVIHMTRELRFEYASIVWWNASTRAPWLAASSRLQDYLFAARDPAPHTTCWVRQAGICQGGTIS